MNAIKSRTTTRYYRSTLPFCPFPKESRAACEYGEKKKEYHTHIHTCIYKCMYRLIKSVCVCTFRIPTLIAKNIKWIIGRPFCSGEICWDDEVMYVCVCVCTLHSHNHWEKRGKKNTRARSLAKSPTANKEYLTTAHFIYVCIAYKKKRNRKNHQNYGTRKGRREKIK